MSDGTEAVLVSLAADAGEIELTGGKPANRFNDADSVAEVIYQLVGFGSTCWESMEGTGIFQDAAAQAGAKEGLERLRQLGQTDKPNLGLATTQQLLDEITTRIRIDYYSGGGGLDYTTVGGRPGGYGVGPV